MENPKYILVMRQVASDYDGISHELFQIANNLERMDQFNPQQKLFSLVRNAEVSTVSLRNLTARTVRDDTAHFYGEVADLLGIRIDETHDWLKITVPAILPKRNQRDNSYVTTMFNDGQIHIAKWVRNALDLNDGDELLFEVVDNKIIFTKAEG